METRNVATGLSHGHRAFPEHAENAVKRALTKAGRERANAILLFLTPEYAANPEPALRAAARAGGCLQVVGCTGAGILTESEWVLDSPGAAAMVLAGNMQLNIAPAAIRNDEEMVLSLCTPAGLTADWLDVPARRIGAISSLEKLSVYSSLDNSGESGQLNAGCAPIEAGNTSSPRLSIRSVTSNSAPLTA